MIQLSEYSNDLLRCFHWTCAMHFHSQCSIEVPFQAHITFAQSLREARLWKCYFIAWNRTNENERYKNISNQNYIQQMNELLMKAYSPPHNVRLGGWSHQMIAEWKSIRNHHIQATFRGDHSSWPMRTNNRTKSSQLITLISSSVETCALNIT